MMLLDYIRFENNAHYFVVKMNPCPERQGKLTDNNLLQTEKGQTRKASYYININSRRCIVWGYEYSGTWIRCIS